MSSEQQVLLGLGGRRTINITVSSNTENYSVDLPSQTGYLAGYTDFILTVNSGRYCWGTANSTTSVGMTITGGTSGDTLYIVNNGYIIGGGGDATVGAVGNTGRPALSISLDTTIDNQSGYIAGGGGAGGAGYLTSLKAGTSGVAGGGGGAGGGKGGGTYLNSTLTENGGAGGAIGQAGSNGTDNGAYTSSGGGGRIVPGTGGAGGANANDVGKGGGAGGGAGYGQSGAGGAGGSANNAGETVTQSGTVYHAGGGGGWGADGGSGWIFIYTAQTSPGIAGGNAIVLNGHSVTWVGGSASSSRAYGAVS